MNIGGVAIVMGKESSVSLATGPNFGSTNDIAIVNLEKLSARYTTVWLSGFPSGRR